MPKDVTTNVQLQQLAKRIRIPYFRDIFMRTTLPTEGVYRNESGIVNLDNADRPGTHWVYAKRRDVLFTLIVLAIFEGISAIFRRNANRVQSHALSTLRLKQLWTTVSTVFTDS